SPRGRATYWVARSSRAMTHFYYHSLLASSFAKHTHRKHQDSTMNELDGSVAIVTGAARNIGRAIALELAQGGASIAVAARSDMKAAEAVVEEIVRAGGKAFALSADVAKEDQVKHMVDETVARYGRLDILVNNASVRPEAPIESISLKDWRQVMAVTLDGP